MGLFTSKTEFYSRLTLRRFLEQYGTNILVEEATAEEIADCTGRHYLVKCQIGSSVRVQADFYPQSETSGRLSVFQFIRRGYHELTTPQVVHFDGLDDYGHPAFVA